MKFSIYLKKATFSALVLFLFAAFAAAQTASFPAPKQEKLLNGLKVLMWDQPNAGKVSVKLRIHSGSAFDPQDKEGVMALLSDILFPNEQIKEFFAEDIGGSLEVESTYDYIQINATGDKDRVLTILETIASAVSNPPIDKENTAKVRNARLEKLKAMSANAAFIAEKTAREKLLGSFPYGRPQTGSEESLAKIDFADLLFAQERFLTADNATLAVSGDIDRNLVHRAARRYFGGWRKSEKRVPSTFAEPDAPQTETFALNLPNAESAEIRYALRGLARGDKDFHAAQILTKILQNRLTKHLPAGTENQVFARQDARILPSVVIFGYAATSFDEKKTENAVAALMKEPISAEEFSRAKAEFSAEFNKTNAMDFWLDLETYKLPAAKEEAQKAADVSLADVKRVAEKFKNQPVITVLVRKPVETAETPVKDQSN